MCAADNKFDGLLTCLQSPRRQADGACLIKNRCPSGQSVLTPLASGWSGRARDDCGFLSSGFRALRAIFGISYGASIGRASGTSLPAEFSCLPVGLLSTAFFAAVSGAGNITCLTSSRASFRSPC